MRVSEKFGPSEHELRLGVPEVHRAKRQGLEHDVPVRLGLRMRCLWLQQCVALLIVRMMLCPSAVAFRSACTCVCCRSLRALLISIPCAWRSCPSRVIVFVGRCPGFWVDDVAGCAASVLQLLVCVFLLSV